MLFKKVQTQAEFVGLSVESYQAIYELLLTKSPQSIRLMDGYSMVHIQIVLDEAKRLENEINSRMSGGYVIDEATYDNDGIELTPVVYYSLWPVFGGNPAHSNFPFCRVFLMLLLASLNSFKTIGYLFLRSVDFKVSLLQ